MTDDLTAIKDALAAATPGEWLVEVPHPDNYQSWGVEADGAGVASCDYDNPAADAAYIAACNPARMARIVAELERLRADAELWRFVVASGCAIKRRGQNPYPYDEGCGPVFGYEFLAKSLADAVRAAMKAVP